jgi:site-specific recombinase XerD
MRILRTRQSISDKEEIAMKTLAAVVQSFIAAGTADGRAPRTIHDYHRTLKPFAAWCNDLGFGLNTLDRDAVRRYVVMLRSRGWPEGTVNIYIRNLRTLLRWLHEEGYTETNLACAIKAPKKTVRMEAPLTPEDILLLLSACQGDQWAVRDQAIIMTFLDTGLRIGEMARLRRTHFQRDENRLAWIAVYSKKTDSPRLVRLGRVTSVAVEEYLVARSDTSKCLWIGRRGPLTDQGIYRTVRRRAQTVGLEERVHPHAFRKFFATRWVANGGDLMRLMWLGGWTTMEMLEIYVVLSQKEDLAIGHQQFGPVDRIVGMEQDPSACLKSLGDCSYLTVESAEVAEALKTVLRALCGDEGASAQARPMTCGQPTSSICVAR